MKRSGLISVLAVSIAVYSYAQPRNQDSLIQLGGIQLELGMSQEEALRKLSVVYDVRHVDSTPGNWIILRKGGPPYRNIGLVAFTRERLGSVSRSWGPESDNQTASALAASIHGAVESVAGSGRACNVSARGTAGSQTMVVLQCGRRQVSIFVPLNSEYAAGVSEEVRAAP